MLHITSTFMFFLRESVLPIIDGGALFVEEGSVHVYSRMLSVPSCILSWSPPSSFSREKKIAACQPFGHHAHPPRKTSHNPGHGGSWSGTSSTRAVRTVHPLCWKPRPARPARRSKALTVPTTRPARAMQRFCTMPRESTY